MNPTTPLVAGSGRGPSPSIWGSIPWREVRDDPGNGIYYFDDFISTPLLTTAPTITENGLYAALDGSVTAGPLATEVGGVLRFDTTTTDNDWAYLTTGSNASGMLALTLSTGYPTVFEARVRLDALAANGLLVGMGEEGLATAATLADDTAALADKDFVGFHLAVATPATLNARYNKASAGGVTTVGAAATLVAATWYKLGWRFNLRDPQYTLRYYVDGAFIVGANPTSTTLFPSGEELAMIFGHKINATAGSLIDLDWWGCCQTWI